jgi:hypothetical protein
MEYNVQLPERWQRRAASAGADDGIRRIKEGVHYAHSEYDVVIVGLRGRGSFCRTESGGGPQNLMITKTTLRPGLISCPGGICMLVPNRTTEAISPIRAAGHYDENDRQSVELMIRSSQSHSGTDLVRVDSPARKRS